LQPRGVGHARGELCEDFWIESPEVFDGLIEWAPVGEVSEEFEKRAFAASV